MSTLERLMYGLIWIGLVLIAVLPILPDDSNTFDLVLAMVRMDFQAINPLTFAVFNMLGVLPAACAAILLYDHDQPPPQPFVIGSFFLGSFALLPYLALRRVTTPLRAAPGRIIRALGSRVAGIILMTIAVGLFAFGIAQGDLGAYAEALLTSKFITLMSLDLLVLTAALHRLVAIDRRRRNLSRHGPMAWVSLFVPLAGPLCYLMVRPQS